MITCDKALELLSLQLDGALTIEQQAELSAHLSMCPDCRAVQKELAAIDEALPTLTQEPPRLLHDTVMQQIRRETRRKKERKPILRFVGVMAAAAALLAVLAGFQLVSLPGFDHGEAAVSMADSLFPKGSAAQSYAKELSRKTGCRVILVEGCSPEDLGGDFTQLENGLYSRELSEAALDAIEAAVGSQYPMTVCGTRGEADDPAYLLCTG